MKQPFVYEINTRCWMRDLSARLGRDITLGTVPDAGLERLRRLGFTHIWLMGVWPTGPRSRAVALADTELCSVLTSLLPDWKEEDIAGSPFAIANYTVSPGLGGEQELEAFRKKLRAFGMRLLLDYVPNHLGLDHPWVVERPDLFVQAPAQAPETFYCKSESGGRWLAHGKDPNFVAWADTVQLDVRRSDTRACMIETLKSVATRCDGVRCDMAMLLLNDVFARTWGHFPCPESEIEGEFWAEAISAVKKTQPEFLFLGEVYWDLEARLQSLGFDYTYDKRPYDYLVYHDVAGVHRHLLSVTRDFIRRSAHFLENHDELRAASIFTLPEHRAAALLSFGLPGLRLAHEGQLTGARIKTPVQLSRRPCEPPQPQIEAFYERLLTSLEYSAVGRGKFEILRPHPAWPDNSTDHNFVAVQWQSQPDSFDLVVVNLAPHRSQCFVSLTVEGLAQRNWQMKDLLGEEEHQRYGDDLQNQGLYLDLPDHGAQLFHFTPL